MKKTNDIKVLAGCALVGLATTLGGCVADDADMLEVESISETEQALVVDPTFTNAVLKSSVGSGFCLDVQGGIGSSGTNVQIWWCNGTTAQKWNKTAAGELRSALNSNLCLDVQGGKTANGTNVRIYTCNGTASQKWTKTASGAFVSALGSNVCLDVQGGNATTGTNVQIFSCNDTDAQKWEQDECTTSANACDPNASCQDTQYSYTCTCNSGYAGDGVTCTDINECLSPGACIDLRKTCRNTPGSYECVPKEQISNGGFESCPNCPDWWSSGTWAAMTDAHKGYVAAKLGGSGIQMLIPNDMTIPQSATKATFSFWLRVKETNANDDNNKFLVKFEDRTAGTSELLVNAVNVGTTAGYVKYSFDVTSHKGHDVDFVFGAVNYNDQSLTSFYIDDVSLWVELE